MTTASNTPMLDDQVLPHANAFCIGTWTFEDQPSPHPTHRLVLTCRDCQAEHRFDVTRADDLTAPVSSDDAQPDYTSDPYRLGLGPHPSDVSELTYLLGLISGFESDEQRARFLLTCNWMRNRGAAAAKRIRDDLERMRS